MFAIFAGLAEFERELIVERTKAGLASARARGRHGGRPFKMTTAKLRLAQAAMGIRLEDEPGWSLEVENERGTSTVWDDTFPTDDAAYAAFRQTVDEESMRVFLDQAVVIPFRR